MQLLPGHTEGLEDLFRKVELFFLDTEQIRDPIDPISIAGAKSDRENLVIAETRLTQRVDIGIADFVGGESEFLRERMAIVIRAIYR